MKFIPILFSTPMVQAILGGRKTQTRRVLKLSKYHPSLPHKQPEVKTVKDLKLYDGNGELEGDLVMRYGKPGDVLWVRECFNYIHDGHSDKFIRYGYKADWVEGITSHPKNKGIWKPSIHMPKKACRLFLRIKDIRVERLKDISEIDAIAEGIHAVDKKGGFILYENYRKNYRPSILRDPNKSFFSLWESINGKESLELNPWVWVIEFEKIEKPENFI